MHVLIQAAKDRRLDCLDRFLNEGADPNVTTANGVTPLMAACGFFDLYEDRRSPRKHPLHFALTAAAGKLLKEAGADLDAADVNGMTPLLYAASFNRASLAKWLWTFPANRGATTRMGQSIHDLATGDLAEWLNKEARCS